MKRISLVFGVLFAVLLNSSCSSEQRTSGTEYYGTTKVEYINVTQEAKDSLDVTLKMFMARLSEKNNFLDSMEIVVVRTYDDLNDTHSFKTFLRDLDSVEEEKGTSFYSDRYITPIIIIREGSHGWSDKLFNNVQGLGFSYIPTLRHSLMHEIGHQFDEYFGHDHEADFALQWDSVLYAKEKDKNQNPYVFDLTDDEDEVRFVYNRQSGLSDTPAFKVAFMEDLKYLAKLKETSPERMPVNWEYYTQGIDWGKLTMDEVEFADEARTETYANVFAYGIGENDGDRTDFCAAFKHSYEVVLKDIKKFLP